MRGQLQNLLIFWKRQCLLYLQARLLFDHSLRLHRALLLKLRRQLPHLLQRQWLLKLRQPFDLRHWLQPQRKRVQAGLRHWAQVLK